MIPASRSASAARWLVTTCRGICRSIGGGLVQFEPPSDLFEVDLVGNASPMFPRNR